MNCPSTRRLSAVIFSCALAGAVPAVAQETTESTLDAICVNRANGQMRFVVATEACRTTEVRVTLDLFVGPQGPPGPTGPPYNVARR